MSNNKIEFKKGKIFFSSSQFFLFPINSFMCLMNKIFENESEEKILLLLSKCSKNDTIILFETLQKNKDINSQNINSYLDIINNFGIGKVNLKLILKTKIVFTIETLNLSNYYQKIYSKNH